VYRPLKVQKRNQLSSARTMKCFPSRASTIQIATRHPRLNTRVLRQDIVQEISRICEMAIFKTFRY